MRATDALPRQTPNKRRYPPIRLKHIIIAAVIDAGALFTVAGHYLLGWWK